MPSYPNSSLRRLVERDKRQDPPTSASVAPVIDEAEDDEPPEADDSITIDDAEYTGLTWDRVPHLERRQKEHAKGVPSWIYRYGWPVYHRERQRNYWLCRYCHVHKRAG